MKCKHFLESLLTGYKASTVKVEQPKKKPKNIKSWSKNKEKKAHKQLDKSTLEEPQATDDNAISRDHDNTHEEEEPKKTVARPGDYSWARHFFRRRGRAGKLSRPAHPQVQRPK